MEAALLSFFGSIPSGKFLQSTTAVTRSKLRLLRAGWRSRRRHLMQEVWRQIRFRPTTVAIKKWQGFGIPIGSVALRGQPNPDGQSSGQDLPMDVFVCGDQWEKGRSKLT